MLATNWSLTFPHSFLKFVGVSTRSSSWNISFLQVFTQTLSSGSLLLYFSEKMRSWIQAVYYQLWKIPRPGLFNLSICIFPAPQIRNSWRPRPGWEHNGDSVFVNLMLSTANLTRFCSTQDTNLYVPVREFPCWVRWPRKIYLLCNMTWDLEGIRRGKETEPNIHLSLGFSTVEAEGRAASSSCCHGPCSMTWTTSNEKSPILKLLMLNVL